MPTSTPALGIDLGGTKIEAVVLAAPHFNAETAGGHHNDVLWRERVPTPQGSYSDTLQALAGLAARARAATTALAGAEAARQLSIGMGTPGCEAANGRMKNCNSAWLNGQALRQDLQALLGQPLALANDANCLALSEASDGAGAGAGVVFAAILGTGAGAGIVVHGRLLQGPNGLAGEWGHNPLPWVEASDLPLPACYCGQRGCVETYVSGSGLAADHLRITGLRLNGEAIVAAAAAGDSACQATLARHVQRLARALAGVINLLDPDIIVLGGGLSRLEHLYTQVPALWGHWVLHAGADADAPREPVRTRLQPARHGDASGVRGAAWLGREARVRQLPAS